MTDTEIAKVCYETIRAINYLDLDYSRNPWPKASSEEKTFFIKCVDQVREADFDPKKTHEVWRRVRAEEGWVFGAVKDPDAKTHPCMIPYEELPPIEKAKDEIFATIVKTLSEDS